MTTIEKIQNYIAKTEVPNDKYEMRTAEMCAICDPNNMYQSLLLAFEYGRAKGLRAARAEAGK